MCLMFLFAWLDWCIDILDFEKIQFFVSWAIFGVFSSAILEPNFAVEFVASLCVLIGPVEYSMVRKVFKTCQMTLNVHFDEKIIVRRCVVPKISYIEKCFDIQVITTFTAIHFNMNVLTGKVRERSICSRIPKISWWPDTWLIFWWKKIVRRCVVLKISYIEKCLDIQVITTFTAVHFNMITFWSVLF